jgi:serine/threonine-protein kinase
VSPQYSPEVLSQKARDLIQHLGFWEPPADSAYEYYWNTAHLTYVQKNDKPSPRWNEVLKGRPLPLQFWFRQSPYPLTGLQFHDDLLTPGIVQQGDPPPILSGMINLKLDAQGRLLFLERIPPQKLEPTKDQRAPDWNALFGAAGLDPAQFQPTEPLWTWLATSDVRAAWTGVWPGTTRPLRVEAAALRGQPVAFSLIGPWSPTDRMPPRQSTGRENGQFIFITALTLVVVIGTWLLVRRNVKKGGGDIAGATRLAGWVGMAEMGLWLFRSHLALSMGTLAMCLIAIATAIFYAFVVRSMYLALEPHVRRRWPQTLISWTAVLAGHWRDPIIGRDVLAGALLAIAVRLINTIASLTLPVTDPPDVGATNVLLGIRSTLAVFFVGIPHGIRDTLLFFFVIFVLRVFLRNQWLATAGFMLIFAAQNALQSNHPVIDGIAGFVIFGLIAALVLRFGLLALAVFIFVDGVVSAVQVTTNASAWYFGNDLLLLGAILALAAWGFHTSIAGRKLWKQDLLE